MTGKQGWTVTFCRDFVGAAERVPPYAREMSVREFIGKFIPAVKPKPVLSRQEALTAIPIRNPLLEWERTEEGELLLKVPVEQRSLVIRWAIAAFRLPPVRHIQLDEVGAAVWELCDGEHTVESIVQQMCKRTRMSRREVEASVSMFLKMLADRRLVAFKRGGKKKA